MRTLVEDTTEDLLFNDQGFPMVPKSRINSPQQEQDEIEPQRPTTRSPGVLVEEEDIFAQPTQQTRQPQTEVVPKAEGVTPMSSELDEYVKNLADFDRQAQEFIAIKMASVPPKYASQMSRMLESQYQAERQSIVGVLQSMGGEAYAKLPVEGQYKADQLRNKYELDGLQATRLAIADQEARAAIDPILAEFADKSNPEYGAVFAKLFGQNKELPDGTVVRSGGVVSQTPFGTLKVNNPGELNKLLDDMKLQKRVEERGILYGRETDSIEAGDDELKIIEKRIKVLEEDAKVKRDMALEADLEDSERLEDEAARFEKAALDLRDRRASLLGVDSLLESKPKTTQQEPKDPLATKVELLLQTGAVSQTTDGLLQASPSANEKVIRYVAMVNKELEAKKRLTK